MKSIKHRRLVRLCVMIMVGLFIVSGCTPNIERMEKNQDVEGLIKVLGNEDEELRHEAVVALGNFGDTRAVEPLIGLLKTENSRYLYSVIDALGELKDPRAVEPLIEIMTIKHVRGNAALALGEIGDDRAIVPLITYMGISADVYDLKDIQAVLLKFGEAAVIPLIDALKDEDPWLATRAAELLGEIGDEQAIQPLIIALDDSMVQAAAAVSLRKFGEVAVDPLIQALTVDRIDYAYYPLILIGSERTESVLIETLDILSTKEVAENYLNSGNERLEEAARKWASSHGYMITKLPGWGGPVWGYRP